MGLASLKRSECPRTSERAQRPAVQRPRAAAAFSASFAWREGEREGAGMAPPRSAERARAGERPRRQQRRRMLGASGRLGAPKSAPTCSRTRLTRPDSALRNPWKPRRPRRRASAHQGGPRGGAFERRGALGRAPGRAWRTLEALEEPLGSFEGHGDGFGRSRKAAEAQNVVFSQGLKPQGAPNAAFSLGLEPPGMEPTTGGPIAGVEG